MLGSITFRTFAFTSGAKFQASGLSVENFGSTAFMYAFVNDGADALFMMLVILQVLTSRLKSTQPVNMPDILVTFCTSQVAIFPLNFKHPLNIFCIFVTADVFNVFKSQFKTLHPSNISTQ
jgi:hypothetical protein